ncbi:hypothetical protein L5515_011182 [Caenorhabditis briggsae]|uniref:Uncharacterized protein n=2 Tax=Caenorhabditis briggsae TaxID=6238 RepID=A0AAE9JF48_CAEBR|nr:hypothetical protein L3Y34_004061 [Caenorhabditis briggsae]UMM28264.1 hypothetical protein L5515_011182 [Caenorhabditis briggsae]
MLFSHQKVLFCFNILRFLIIFFFITCLSLGLEREVTEVQATVAVTTTLAVESDAIWCPTNRVGNQCPEETLLSFYKCCGHLNKECCFHMRVWIVIMIIVLPICLVLPATTFILRRLLCPSKQPARGPSTADRVRQLAAEDSTTYRRDSDDMVML